MASWLANFFSSTSARQTTGRATPRQPRYFGAQGLRFQPITEAQYTKKPRLLAPCAVSERAKRHDNRSTTNFERRCDCRVSDVCDPCSKKWSEHQFREAGPSKTVFNIRIWADVHIDLSVTARTVIF